MSYTNSIEKMKWWYAHTKKLKYCSSGHFYEHNDKFGKGRSTGSTLTNRTNIPPLTKLENYLSYHPFIKDDIFEATVKFPPKDTTIGIIYQ